MKTGKMATAVNSFHVVYARGKATIVPNSHRYCTVNGLPLPRLRLRCAVLMFSMPSDVAVAFAIGFNLANQATDGGWWENWSDYHARKVEKAIEETVKL